MKFEMTAVERQARIVRYLTDMAPAFYPFPGDAGRYVVEAYFKDATRDEIQFGYQYVADHPEIKTGPKQLIHEVQDGYHELAKQRSSEAAAAFRAGDHAQALALLREAYLLHPEYASQWERYASHVEAASLDAALT